MDLDAIQLALREWVKSATGFDDGHVFWAQQPGSRPPEVYVSMLLRGIQGVGLDWSDVTDNPTPAAGEEILHLTRGPRVGLLTIQCFNGAAFGNSSAVAVLNKVAGNVRKPSIKEALQAACVGVLSIGNVIEIGGPMQSSHIEPRAVMDVRLGLAEQLSETGTYIESVDTQGTITVP